MHLFKHLHNLYSNILPPQGKVHVCTIENGCIPMGKQLYNDSELETPNTYGIGPQTFYYRNYFNKKDTLLFG